jgi:two-component SAPR family response regulator
VTVDSQSLSGERILVVEDQYLLAKDVCEWLQEAGAQVIGPVSDADSACELIEKHHVDTAVVDINLGEGPSYQVAIKLSERDVPFVFATGYDEPAIPAEFKSRPRLEKPFHGPGLVRAVRALR